MEPIGDGSKYFLIWKTPAACPYVAKDVLYSLTFLRVYDKSEGAWSFLGAILNLIKFLLLGFILYMVIGMVYNGLVLSRTGWDLLPNGAFWKDVSEFLMELFINIRNRLSSTNTSTGGGYQQI